MKDKVTTRNRQKTPLLNVFILMSGFVVLPSMLMTGFALAAVLRPDRATRDIALTITFGITLLVGAVVVFRAYYGQVKLSRLQTDFVSHISHELRTPLTSIRLFVDTLEQKRTVSVQQTEECLRLLSQETERLSQMVERILSYARMEAGRREYQLAPVKANDIAEGTLQAFKARHLMRPFSVALALDPQATWIIADEAAVTEALLNILDNAVKYTGNDKKISLTTARHKEGIAFSIRDNGTGIARAERRRIFDQFYRIDNLLSRSSSGSGLGLAIARHIVSAHGGRIYVESEPGQGTMFSIVLRAA